MSIELLWGAGIQGEEVDLVTDEGDLLITDEGDQLIVLEPASGGAAVWETADVTTDGTIPFDILWTSNPWQPPAPDGTVQGGEHTFQWAYLTFSWSMGATIRVSAFVDGDAGIVETDDGKTIENVPSTFTLDQQGGTLQRKSQVFAVPLVRRVLDADGNELLRAYLRGERLQIVVENTGQLGVGELLLEGVEVECSTVRKAIYPGNVDSTPG